MIDAYENVLLRKRKKEREILNAVRYEEYERNRPPEQKWYEFKHNGFNKELYRNRVALKPNNENKVYLERLRDENIYWCNPTCLCLKSKDLSGDRWLTVFHNYN